MVKVRTRRLWLDVRFRHIPENVSETRIIRTLIRSIERGDYRLPRSWEVVVRWKNKEMAEYRQGRWADELTASAKSSDGFDKAMLNYLNGKL